MNNVVVSMDSAIPVYEQIRSQVAAAVAVGALQAGDRLPASRDLARDLGIAVGTVQRAYKELEATGVVDSRRRTGTVIASQPDSQQQAANTLFTPPNKIIELAQSFVSAARKAGLSDAMILDLIRGCIAAQKVDIENLGITS